MKVSSKTFPRIRNKKSVVEEGGDQNYAQAFKLQPNTELNSKSNHEATEFVSHWECAMV